MEVLLGHKATNTQALCPGSYSQTAAAYLCIALVRHSAQQADQLVCGAAELQEQRFSQRGADDVQKAMEVAGVGHARHIQKIGHCLQLHHHKLSLVAASQVQMDASRFSLLM